VLRRDLARLGGKPSCLGDGRRVPRPSALNHREGPRDQRHHQGRRDGDEQAAETTCAAPRSTEFARLRILARVKEVAFDA